MTVTEAMWLRGKAAQQDVLHLVSYGTAFVGTAAVQAVMLGLTAPRSYWAALGRAATAPPRSRGKPVRRPLAEVVSLTPATLPAPELAQVAPEAAAPSAAVHPFPHLLDGPRGGEPDDLTLLKGVGPKLAVALNEFGIYHFDQIAALDEAAIAAIEAQQKGFRMICARNDIVTQARALV